MKNRIIGLLIIMLIGVFAVSQAADKWVLQPLPVDSSGAPNGGSVLDANGGFFDMRISTLEATADSNWMTFRLGPILSEGVTAILGWLQLSYYADSGTVANDTLTCRLFTSNDPGNSALDLAAIDSNKFTGTGVWALNIANDTIFKKWLYIDMEAITPENLIITDSTNYQQNMTYRVIGELIKQKYE
jgi:hypothetical protein